MDEKESGRLKLKESNRKSCPTCGGTKVKKRTDGAEGVEDCNECDGDGMVIPRETQVYDAR